MQPRKHEGTKKTRRRASGRVRVFLRLQNLVDEKEIGEERAQVDRRVQVVDELGADRLLRQREANRGLRIARVALEDAGEGAVRLRRLEAEPVDRVGHGLSQS